MTPDIFDNGDVAEGVIEDVPPVVEDAREESGDFNGFWGWVYDDYAGQMDIDGDAARIAGQKALESVGGDIQQARWVLSLGIYTLTKKEALKALGVKSLQEWLAAEEGRTPEAAIAEVLAVAGKGAE